MSKRTNLPAVEQWLDQFFSVILADDRNIQARVAKKEKRKKKSQEHMSNIARCSYSCSP